MSKLFRLLILPLFLFSLLLPLSGNVAAAPAHAGTAPTPTPPNCIPIKKAVAQGSVKLTLTGSGQLFFKSPLHYQLVNLTSQALQICFPAGQIANPSDPGEQSLMIAQDVVVDLAPNQTQEGDLEAFCINQHKAAPSDGMDYQFGPMAEGKLLKLSGAIQTESAGGHWGAQLAVWAITDHYDLAMDFQVTPDPNQPSLADSIRPLFCLAQDDTTLGQKLLQDAGTGVNLYQGENPLVAYCQSQGIPSLGQIGQRLKILGIEAAVATVVGALLCVGVLVGLIVLIVRLARGPRKAAR